MRYTLTESSSPTQTWLVMGPSRQEIGESYGEKTPDLGVLSVVAGLTDTQPYCLIFKPFRNQQTPEETSNSKQKSKAHRKPHHPCRVKKDEVSEKEPKQEAKEILKY